MLGNKDIGIDLGTANTLVYLKGKGVILREPSVVAINRDTKQVLAVGDEAKEMLGRTPGNIIAVRPLKDGVIANYNMTSIMLKYFIKKACGSALSRRRIVICVPSGVTEVEKRAVEDAALTAGAREVYLIEEPMAAAIGANMAIAEPRGIMIVDIGGGTSEVAVISLGGIVTSKSVRIAGDELDNAIIQYVKKKFNLMIGERTAEETKLILGSAYDDGDNHSMEIRGRFLLDGLPKSVTITTQDIREAMSEGIYSIVDEIKITLEKTPPELSSDIIENGIVLSGGGALISGLDKLIKMETDVTTTIAENPLDCVVLGTGKVLEDIEILKATHSQGLRR